MKIINFKFFKVISSIVLFTFFVSLLRDYSYAASMNPTIPTLNEIRKNAGEQYTKSFVYLGVNEEVAIENNANKFINTISNAYEEHKNEINENFSTQKKDVIDNKNANISRIQDEYNQGKTSLYNGFVKNREIYENNYQKEKTNILAHFDKSINESKSLLSRYQNSSNTMDEISGDESDRINSVNKTISKINRTKGSYANNVSSIDASPSISNDYNPKIRKLKAKIESLEKERDKALQGLETRRDYHLKEQEENYAQDMNSLEMRTNGYIEELEILTDEKLNELELNKEIGIETLYENSMTEINNYLFNGENGLFHKAYDWDNQSIMRDLKATSEGNKTIKTLEREGGYIGDIKKYNAIQELEQNKRALDNLNFAEKYLSSGANNGFDIAKKYTEEASMLGKQVAIVEPNKTEQKGKKSKSQAQIDYGSKIGEEGKEVVEGESSSRQTEQSLKNLSTQKESINSGINQDAKRIKSSQDNATNVATESMGEKVASDLDYQEKLTLQQMQDVLNFINQLEYYLNLAWPSDASSGIQYATDEVAKAEELVEEAQKKWIGALVALILTSFQTFMTLYTLVCGIVLKSVALAALAPMVGVCPCVYAVIAASLTLAIILSVIMIAATITGFIVSLIYFITCQNELAYTLDALDKAKNKRTAYENALFGLVRNDSETDEEFEARKKGANTSYTRYLKAQEDYEKAMQEFRYAFWEQFGKEKGWSADYTVYKIRQYMKEIKDFIGNRDLAKLSERELRKLEDMLYKYGFVSASRNTKFRGFMNNLSDKYDKYQRAMKELEEDQTKVQYKDPDTGKIEEITMAEAYKQFKFWSNVVSYLQEKANELYENRKKSKNIQYWLDLNNAFVNIFGGKKVVFKDGNVAYEQKLGFLAETSQKWLDAAGAIKIKGLREVAMLFTRIATVFVMDIGIRQYVSLIFGGIQQMNMYTDLFEGKGTFDILKIFGVGVTIGSVADVVGGILGMKKNWLVNWISGQSFLEAVGWDKGFNFDVWVKNFDYSAAYMMVVRMVAGKVEAKMREKMKQSGSQNGAYANSSEAGADFRQSFSDVAPATSGFFSSIASDFKAGGWRILLGIAKIIVAPVVATALLAVDVTVHFVKGIIQTGKDIWNGICRTVNNVKQNGFSGLFTSTETGKGLVNVWKNAGGFVKEATTSTFSKVSEFFGGGLLGTIIGGIAAAGVAVGTAVLSLGYGIMGTMSAIMGSDNGNEKTTGEISTQLENALANGNMFEIFSTMGKGILKFAANAFMDIDVDSVSKMNGLDAFRTISQGFMQLLENVQTTCLIVGAAATGNWALALSAVPIKMFDNWYNRNVQGIQKERRDRAEAAMEGAFGEIELNGQGDIDVNNETQISAILGMVDVKGGVYVKKDGEEVFMIGTDFEEYVASGGNISEIRVDVKGNLVKFNISDSLSDTLRQSVISQMSYSKLSLMSANLSKKQRESGQAGDINLFQRTKDLISKQMVARTTNEKLNILNLMSNDQDVSIEISELNKKYEKEKEGLKDLRDKVKSGDKEAQKQYDSLVTKMGKEEVNIGGVTLTIRELSILTGHDFCDEILSDMSLGINNVRQVISNALKEPKIQTTIQETITFRNTSQTNISNLNDAVENTKKNVKNFIDEDIEEQSKKLDKLKLDKQEIQDNIDALEAKKTKLENQDYTEFFSEDEKGEISILKKNISDLNKQLENDDIEIQKYKMQITDEQNDYDNIVTKNKGYQMELENVDKDIESINDEYNNLNAKLKIIKEDNEKIIEEQESLQQKLKSDQDKYNNIKEDVKKQEEETQKYESEITKLKQDMEENENKILALKKKQETYEIDLAEYQKKKVEIDAEIDDKNQNLKKFTEEKTKLLDEQTKLNKEIADSKQKLEKQFKEDNSFDKYFEDKTKKLIRAFNKVDSRLKGKVEEALRDLGLSENEINNISFADTLNGTKYKLKNLHANIFNSVVAETAADNFKTAVFDKITSFLKKKYASFINDSMKEYVETNQMKLKSKLEDINNSLTANEAQITTIKKNINELKNSIIPPVDFSDEIGKLEAKNKNLSANIVAKTDNLNNAKKELNSKKIEKNNLEISINNNQNKLKNLKTKDYDDLKMQIASMEELLKNKKSAKQIIEKSISDNNEQMKNIKQKIEDKNKIIDGINKKSEKTKAEINDNENKLNSFGSQSKLSELKKIEELINAEKQKESYQNFYKSRSELEKAINDLKKSKANLENNDMTLDDFYKIVSRYKDDKSKKLDNSIDFENFKENFEILETNVNNQFKDKKKITLNFISDAGGADAEKYYKGKIQELMFMKGDANFFSKERKDLSDLIDNCTLTSYNLEIHRLSKSKKNLESLVNVENSEDIISASKSLNSKDLNKLNENFDKIRKKIGENNTDMNDELQKLVGGNADPETYDFTKLDVKKLGKVKDYLEYKRQEHDLYGDAFAIKAEYRKMYIKEVFKSESDKALDNVETYIASSKTNDISLLKNNLKTFQKAAQDEMTSLLTNELKDMNVEISEENLTKIKENKFTDDDIKNIKASIKNNGGNEDNIDLIVKTVKDLNNVSEGFNNFDNETKKIEVVQKYQKDMDDLMTTSDNAIKVLKGRINAKIDQDLNKELDEINSKNQNLVSKRYALKNSGNANGVIEVDGKNMSLKEIDSEIKDNNNKKEQLILNANGKKIKYQTSLTNIQYDIARTVNNNVLQEFVSGYEKANKNEVTLTNFNNKKGEGRETGLVIRRATLSKIETGEIKLDSYVLEHKGQKVSLAHSELKNFMKENDYNGEYSRGMLSNIRKREILDEKRINMSKEKMIGIEEGKSNAKDALENKLLKDIVPIQDKIVESDIEVDKKKALEILNQELEKTTEERSLFGKIVEKIGIGTEKYKRKDTVEKLIKMIEKVEKDTFTSKDLISMQDGKNPPFRELIGEFATRTGQNGINILRAFGYDIDKQNEIEFVSTFNTRKVFIETGVIKDSGELLRQDASLDLRNELKILTIKNSINTKELEKEIDSLDIKNSTKNKAFDKISDEIIDKDEKTLQKVWKSLVETSTNENKQKYEGVFDENNVINKEKAKDVFNKLSLKELREAENTLLSKPELDDNFRNEISNTFRNIRTLKELDYKKETLVVPSLVDSMTKQTNVEMNVWNFDVREEVNSILKANPNIEDLEISYKNIKNLPEDKITQEQKDILKKYEEVNVAKKLDYVLKKLSEADVTRGTVEIDKSIINEMNNMINSEVPYSEQTNLNKMFLTKSMQLIKSNLNGLDGEDFDIIDNGNKVKYTRNNVVSLDKQLNKFVNKELEEKKLAHFAKLDQLIEEPMENIQKKMVETIIKNKKEGDEIEYIAFGKGQKIKITNDDNTNRENLKRFVESARYSDIEKNLGDLSSDEILEAAFPGYQRGKNLTSTQAEIMRTITLKMVEGHHLKKIYKKDEFGKEVLEKEIPFRQVSLTDPENSTTQNQILMMEANDSGYVVALGMGGGKTRVYPLVIASQMLTGKSGTAEILVSARQEVTNMLGINKENELNGDGNKAIMKRFFGVDMQNGTKPEGVNNGNEYLIEKLDNLTNKTILVFDLETRGHLAHDIREDVRLKKLNDIGTVAIDEADALALRTQSYINANKKDATFTEKYQVVKTMEIFSNVVKEIKNGNADNQVADPLIESKVFVNENGTNSMNAQVLDRMLTEMKKDKILMKSLYNPSGITQLEDKKVNGQLQYVIEQIMRARTELKNGETIGGNKTDSVSGIQYNVQDGNSINSIANQIMEKYIKNGGNIADFTEANFMKIMNIKSLDDFKSEVSETTVEASTVEILTRNKGVSLNVFGGSGTVHGAKVISRAVSAPILELSEGTYKDYSFKTVVLKPGESKSEIVSNFMNIPNPQNKVGSLVIQDHKNIKDNLMKTLENRADGDTEILNFLSRVKTVTKGTDRVSTAELSADYGKDGELIDSAFNKQEETGYNSLGYLIRTGKVKYQGDGFHEINDEGNLGRKVDVSMMDILKSRTAIKSMLGNSDEKAENVINKLNTKSIYVIDNYTDADNVSPLAKSVSEKEYSVFATNKAGRGMDFKGKMRELVLDSENNDNNTNLQILGRVGRGSYSNDFTRIVVLDVEDMRKHFQTGKEQLEAKINDLSKSDFYKKAVNTNPKDRTQKQQKVIAEYDDLKSRVSRYGSYISDIENGEERKTIKEMFQDNSLILSDQKANSSSLYQISEGVRTALLKIPLENMIKKAKGLDKMKLEKVRDEFLRKAKGQEADLYRQEDGEYKSGLDTFKKSFESTLDLAEQMYGMLSSNSMKNRTARKLLLGINDGIKDKELLAELKYRKKDIKGTKRDMNLILKKDWNELMYDVQERVEKTGIYTMSQINSSEHLGLGTTVLDTALYIAQDITYNKKKMSDENLIQNVKIANVALTGNQDKGAFKFNTNDESLIGHNIENMKKNNWTFELNKDKYKVSQIFLTPKQYNKIQQSPLVKKIVDDASQSKNLKIIVGTNENMIKNNNTFAYENFGKRVDEKKIKFYEDMSKKNIINVGSNFEDESLDKNAQGLFKRRIKDKNLGIKDEDWYSGNIVVNIDVKRWGELTDSEKKDLTTKFMNKKTEITEKDKNCHVTLAISSDKTNTTISKDLADLNKLDNVFERKEAYLKRQKLKKENMYNNKKEEMKKMYKIKDEIQNINTDISQQKKEIEKLEKNKKLLETKLREEQFRKYTEKSYDTIKQDGSLTAEEQKILSNIKKDVDNRKINFKEKRIKDNKDFSLNDLKEEIDWNGNNIENLNRIVKTTGDSINQISTINISDYEEDYVKVVDKLKKEVSSLETNVSKIKDKLILEEEIDNNIKSSLGKLSEVKNDNFIGQLKLQGEYRLNKLKTELGKINTELKKINAGLNDAKNVGKNLNEFKKIRINKIEIKQELIKDDTTKIEKAQNLLRQEEKKLESKTKELDDTYKHIERINNTFISETNELYINSMKYNVAIESKEIDEKILKGEKIKEDSRDNIKVELAKLGTAVDDNLAKLILEKQALEKALESDNKKMIGYKKTKEEYKTLLKNDGLKDIANKQILSYNDKIKAIMTKNSNKMDRLYELSAILDNKNFENYLKQEKGKIDKIENDEIGENADEWKKERKEKLDKINKTLKGEEVEKDFEKFDEERKKYIESKLNQKYLDNLNKLFTLGNAEYVAMESSEDIEKLIQESVNEKTSLLNNMREVVGEDILVNDSISEKEEKISKESKSEDGKKEDLISESKDLISESKENSVIKDSEINLDMIEEENAEQIEDSFVEEYNKDKDAFYTKIMQKLKDDNRTFDFAKAKDTFGKLNKIDEKIAILTERKDILMSMDPNNLSNFVLSDYLKENYVNEAVNSEEFRYLKAQEIGNIILSTDEDIIKNYNDFDNRRRKSLFNIEKIGDEELEDDVEDIKTEDVTKVAGFMYRLKNLHRSMLDKVHEWFRYLGSKLKEGFVMPKVRANSFIGIFLNIVAILKPIVCFLGIIALAILYLPIRIIVNGVSVILAFLNINFKTGSKFFGQVLLVILNTLTFFVPKFITFIVKKIKYKNIFTSDNKTTLDFSNSVFRETKRNFEAHKITEEEYKDIIAMEIEQKLLDEYIRRENEEKIFEIIVSSKKSQENELAVRQGINAFNEKANAFIGHHKAKLPNIVVRDTRGNIVDVYSNKHIKNTLDKDAKDVNEYMEAGKLISRNEEIENSLLNDGNNNGNNNSMQELFKKFNLNLGSGVKNIVLEKSGIKEQKEEIYEKISVIKTEPVIINLDNVKEKDINEITSYVFREVVESGNITTNIVFKRDGRFFGATEKRVDDTVLAWNNFQNTLGIKNITRENLYKNININSSLIGDNLEINYMTETINQSDIKDETKYEKDKSAYLDPVFIDAEGNKKELYKVDVIGEKVKISLNKDVLEYWNNDRNRQMFMYRLRQIEKQYKDLQKEIEIELPEVETGEQLKIISEEKIRKEKEIRAKNGREKIKKTCETFIDENKDQKTRRFWLQNDKGNILRVNNIELFGNFAKGEDIKEVLIVPEYVLTDEIIFKNWLSQKLQSEKLKQKEDEIVLGLNISNILPGKIQEVINQYFKNENIKVINRRGEIVKITEKDSINKIYKEDGKIEIYNPRMNKNILDSIENMENIETIQITDDFVKDTENVNSLITMLSRKGYKGDINVIGYNKEIIKLWQTQVFKKGAISREIENKKEFNEFLDVVSKTKVLTKMPLVLNINSREKLDLKKLNKLIEDKNLGNVTVLMRGEILATNDTNILKGEEQFEKVRDKEVKKLSTSKIKEEDIKDIDYILSYRKEDEFKKELCIVTDSLKSEDGKEPDYSIESSKINILPIKNIPVYRGNILFNMKGAKDYIKELDNLYDKTNLTNEDIIKISSQVTKVGTYGINFALESHKKMAEKADSDKSITKFLDIAA